MHRLFVGIRPPLAMRDMLVDRMDGIEGARWQEDAQLHLTLRYIGEVERPVAEDIATVLTTIHATAFDLALSGVGTFDKRGRINAIWAGVAPAAPLAALHRKIDHALVRIGLPPEGRAFVPHITLARLNESSGPVGGFLAAHAGLSSDAMSIDNFLLYESHIGRDGSQYDAIARYPLK